MIKEKEKKRNKRKLSLIIIFNFFLLLFLSRCFQFYYYMQGQTNWTGQLSLYHKSPSTGLDGLALLWQMQGPQGDYWNLGQEPKYLVGDYEVGFRYSVWKMGLSKVILLFLVIIVKMISVFSTNFLFLPAGLWGAGG